MLSLRIAAGLAAVLFAACASTDHAPLLREYERVANAGEVEAVVELFDPDAKVYIERELIARGREEIRLLYEYEAARGARREVTEIESSGEAARAVLVVTNDFLEALGIGPLRQPAAFTIDDERFTVLWTGKAAVDAAAMQRQERFYAWMERSHPAEYERLVAQGSAYGPEIGARFVELARAWRASAAPSE